MSTSWKSIHQARSETETYLSDGLTLLGYSSNASSEVLQLLRLHAQSLHQILIDLCLLSSLHICLILPQDLFLAAVDGICNLCKDFLSLLQVAISMLHVRLAQS